MTSKISEIAKFIELNPQMLDIDIKRSIEDNWFDINVTLHKVRLRNPALTMIHLHNELQDNYLMGMIPRDSK